MGVAFASIAVISLAIVLVWGFATNWGRGHYQYETIEEEVGLTEDKIVEEEIPPEEEIKATLIVTGEKGAKIYLNGEYSTDVPSTIGDLELGIYQLEVKKSGFKTYKDNIELTAGENNLDVKLEKLLMAKLYYFSSTG